MSSPVLDPDSAFGAPIRRGGWLVRLARPDDRPLLAALRGAAFRGGGEDRDAYDDTCQHLWVAAEDGPPLATARLMLHPAGDLGDGYAARLYDLAPLNAAPGPALELGRLCTRPGSAEPDLLRLVWAGVTRLVERTGAARLVGCASFKGADPGTHRPALALLAARHLGPAGTRPRRKSAQTFDLTPLADAPLEPGALALMPPILRTYLALGGWVSDHAVIDRDLDTCHVFTCVEIATMPEGRKRILRALAAESPAPDAHP